MASRKRLPSFDDLAAGDPRRLVFSQCLSILQETFGHNKKADAEVRARSEDIAQALGFKGASVRAGGDSLHSRVDRHVRGHPD